MTPRDLTPEERATYEWQMWVPGVGEEGQRKIKGTSVLISRVGRLGWTGGIGVGCGWSGQADPSTSWRSPAF